MDMKMIIWNLSAELKGQLEILSERLEEIRAQKTEQEARVNQEANPFLKVS